jgi:AraC-like DNA-binding protein
MLSIPVVFFGQTLLQHLQWNHDQSIIFILHFQFSNKMDIHFKYMDNFFMHLAPLPRRHPYGPPVQSIGYSPRKHQHVSTTFPSLNFSLLFGGAGTYEWQGRLHAVQAPCVITQWPGVAMNYGPHPGSTWEELFIIYNRDASQDFHARKLLSAEQPCWAIQREAQVLDAFLALKELLHQPVRDGYVDRVDRACEALLLETHLGTKTPQAPSRGEQVVDVIRKQIRENPFVLYDFEKLARSHGLSASTFRRYWNLYVHQPPARYVANLRIRAACRMLVETDQSINEIARNTGFEDPFYFSRCFRQIIGMAPRAYRQRHLVTRTPTTLQQPPWSQRAR